MKNLNFNSHAHVERDCRIVEVKTMPAISTHTLTWSVTRPNGIAGRKFIISTHTLTWSVTSNPSRLFELLANFNSHAHVERDQQKNTLARHMKLFQLTRSRGA